MERQKKPAPHEKNSPPAKSLADSQTDMKGLASDLFNNPLDQINCLESAEEEIIFKNALKAVHTGFLREFKKNPQLAEALISKLQNKPLPPTDAQANRRLFKKIKKMEELPPDDVALYLLGDLNISDQ